MVCPAEPSGPGYGARRRSAALTGHGLRQVALAQAVDPAALAAGGGGKAGATLRSFLTFLGYFALGNGELNIRNDLNIGFSS
ncbi:hypothetical protein D3C79_1032120 [compost metagenome]